MNVAISRVLSLTSFQYLWAKRSSYARSRIGEPTGRNNGSSLKKIDIDVPDADKDCFEGPDGATTPNLQWMWIDLGDYGHSNMDSMRGRRDNRWK